MSDEQVEAKAADMSQCAKTWPEHSCYEWNRAQYVSSPEYLSTVCGTCGRIIGFKWRRPWRRFVSLFTSDAMLRTEVKWKLRHWLYWLRP
jgi:hypothetical protein